MARLKDAFDGRTHSLREKLGGRRPIEIVPYRGFGNENLIWLQGRVLEDRRVLPASADDTIWRNLRNMYRRAMTTEIPLALVRAGFQEREEVIRAGANAFFEVSLQYQQAVPEDRLWHPLELELVEPVRPGQEVTRTIGQVLVPPPRARFGLISDIDDTVIYTNATRWLSMVRTVLLRNAYTRLPLPGVAAFYRALQCGCSTDPTNPLFYVSNGPWNMYDLVTQFLSLNGIPLGPIIMRDWGLSEKGLWPFRPRGHKLAAIRHILDLYPQLPFILVGDSGERDPEIYREAVRLYPRRIAAVYIRAVGSHRSPLDRRGAERVRAVRALAAEIAEAGSQLVLADTTVPLAEHAARQGWIGRADVADIRAQVLAAPSDPPRAPLSRSHL